MRYRDITNLLLTAFILTGSVHTDTPIRKVTLCHDSTGNGRCDMADVPLPGYKVIINGQEYITNQNGQILLYNKQIIVRNITAPGSKPMDGLPKCWFELNPSPFKYIDEVDIVYDMKCLPSEGRDLAPLVPEPIGGKIL